MSEVLNNEKALVVFSGGQDSTTCLFYAKKHFKEVELVTFEYGQRHAKEIEVAKEIAEDQGLKHHVLDMALLSQLTPNALTSHDMTIDSHNDVPNTFVPRSKLTLPLICRCISVPNRCQTSHYRRMRDRLFWVS